MKHSFLLSILVLLFLTACGGSSKKKKINKSDRIDITVKKEEKSTYNANLIKQYRSKLNALNNQNLTSCKLALNAFEDWFKEESSQTCDTAFLIFQDFHTQIVFNNSEFDFANVGIFEDNMYTEEGEFTSETKTAVKKMEKMGFTVGQTEGMLYLNLFPEFVEPVFKSKLSPLMKKYMQLRFAEIKKNATEDAGLAISPKELVDRMEEWTVLIDSFPRKSQLAQQSIYSAQFYRSCLFSNFLDNSYLYYESEESIEISEIHIEAFDYLKNEYPKSVNLKLTRKYIDLIVKKKISEAENEFKKFPKNFMLEGYGS